MSKSLRSGRRPMSRRRLRANLTAYAFVSPWIFSLVVFTAYPVLASFYFAMTKYTILTPPQWVGLENFRVMFTKDPLYWKSVWNTLYYTLFSVPLGLLVALALLLNQSTRGIGIYRTAFYLPSLMPAVAATFLWMLLLDPRLGLINRTLAVFGVSGPGWFRSAEWSKPALIMMSIWLGSGGPMLIFLAGLKEIPQSLLEAAMIDGANAWQRLRHVTVPLLTPTIFFNLLIGVIASFQVFANVYVAASAQGSANSGVVGPLNSMLMYMIFLYNQAFRFYNMGYASAMALVMFLVLVVITLVLVRTSSSWVFYQAGKR